MDDLLMRHYGPVDSFEMGSLQPDPEALKDVIDLHARLDPPDQNLVLDGTDMIGFEMGMLDHGI